MIGYYAGWSVASALAGVVIYANLPTRLTLGAIAPTIEYLAAAPLKKIDNEQSIQTSTIAPIQVYIVVYL